MTTTEDVARPAAPARGTVLDRMGGPWGIAFSAVPVVVFVVAGAFVPLSTTVVVSVAAALAVTGFRLLHGAPLTVALGGMFGVAAMVGMWVAPAAGVPLTVLAALLVVRAFRRSTTRLVTSPAS